MQNALFLKNRSSIGNLNRLYFHCSSCVFELGHPMLFKRPTKSKKKRTILVPVTPTIWIEGDLELQLIESSADTPREFAALRKSRR